MNKIRKTLSIDYNYIDEGISYQVATQNGTTPFVRINKSAFDNIDKKFTKKIKGRNFLACPQSEFGLKNFLPVQFVYKRILNDDGILFVS